jgi:hypothetical protein
MGPRARQLLLQYFIDPADFPKNTVVPQQAQVAI